MVRQKLDPDVKKNIVKAQKWIGDIAQKDANEAETRTRILDIFGMLMGYDRYNNITQEEQVKGAGETKRCDFAVQVIQGESSKPDFLVEVKRVNMDLTLKHLGQAASYAIDTGCEWVLLTNGREWKLYHITYTKPPQTTLIESWNFMNDTLASLDEKFGFICYKNIRKGSLPRLWDKNNVLIPQNLLKIILSEESLKLMRRELRKGSDVTVSPEEIVGAIRHMLNETAIGEMEKVKISLPVKGQRKTTSRNINTN